MSPRPRAGPPARCRSRAEGLAVNEFAGGLDHPRWLLVLPNGDVLVAETDNPGTDRTGGTIRGKIQKMLMQKAGSSKPSPNRISLLRDADGDGVAEVKTALIDRPLFAVRNGAG